jgi:hypothetical protein
LIGVNGIQFIETPPFRKGEVFTVEAVFFPGEMYPARMDETFSVTAPAIAIGRVTVHGEDVHSAYRFRRLSKLSTEKARKALLGLFRKTRETEDA